MEGIVLFFARQDNTHQCRNGEHACLLYFDIQGSDIVAKMIKQLQRYVLFGGLMESSPCQVESRLQTTGKGPQYRESCRKKYSDIGKIACDFQENGIHYRQRWCDVNVGQTYWVR